MQIAIQKISFPLRDVVDSFFLLLNNNTELNEYQIQRLIFSLNKLNSTLENTVLEDVSAVSATESLRLLQANIPLLKEFFSWIKRNQKIPTANKNEIIIRFYKMLYSFTEIIQTLQLFAENESECFENIETDENFSEVKTEKTISDL